MFTFRVVIFCCVAFNTGGPQSHNHIAEQTSSHLLKLFLLALGDRWQGPHRSCSFRSSSCLCFLASRTWLLTIPLANHLLAIEGPSLCLHSVSVYVFAHGLRPFSTVKCVSQAPSLTTLKNSTCLSVLFFFLVFIITLNYILFPPR